jgi:PleD family two-component response regulator
MRLWRRSEAEASAVAAPMGAELRAADVLVVAAHVEVARHLVDALRDADLRVDRAGSAEELEFAIEEALPPPMVVIVVSDDELERLRVRRSLGRAEGWKDLPVLDAGLGGFPVTDLALHLAAHRRHRLAGASI